MAEFLWLKSILPPLVGGLLISLLLERLLRPTPGLGNRPLSAWILHLGFWLAAFAFELTLFQRPYFASSFVLAVWSLLVLVNNAKFSALREPFVYSDFEYFTDALRHPRLYIPFLGVGRVILAVAGFVAAVYVGLTLEAPLSRELAFSALFIVIASLWVSAALLIFIGSRTSFEMTFDPAPDLEKFGLVTCLWHYAAAERRPINLAAYHPIFAATPFAPLKQSSFNNRLPDIVVVQSESFFDVRRVFPHVAPDIFREWDSLCATAIQQGRLEVAAWGANTVRTEFAFLSGLLNETLGIHRFNPYRKLALSGIPSFATYAKKLGYRTVCVHPYAASFYNRATVFPALGFDEFVDIRQFKEADRCGPYIGDVAVAEKVKELLGKNDQTDAQPIFIFVITMENHGPLHWENMTQDETAPFFTAPLPADCESLAVYVRHLANADKMIGLLRDTLRARDQHAYLCWYGDHVPIMPTVYTATSIPDGNTDYLIWQNRDAIAAPLNRLLNIADLGALLLRQAGLMR